MQGSLAGYQAVLLTKCIAVLPQAYAAMMIDEQRQAILISGESGAGKTESAKMVMQVRLAMQRRLEA